MADELEERLARLEAEVRELRELLEQLSIWVTGGREPAERGG